MLRVASRPFTKILHRMSQTWSGFLSNPSCPALPSRKNPQGSREEKESNAARAGRDRGHPPSSSTFYILQLAPAVTTWPAMAKPPIRKRPRPKERSQDHQLSHDHELSQNPQLSQDQPPPAKRVKSSGRQRSNFPPEFWDNLSKLWLEPRALRELDRRNNLQPLSKPTPAEPYATDLARFARHGGPDLQDLRGVCCDRICLLLIAANWRLLCLLSTQNRRATITSWAPADHPNLPPPPKADRHRRGPNPRTRRALLPAARVEDLRPTTRTSTHILSNTAYIPRDTSTQMDVQLQSPTT